MNSPKKKKTQKNKKNRLIRLHYTVIIIATTIAVSRYNQKYQSAVYTRWIHNNNCLDKGRDAM